jgi:tRNA dimethylallyltransferase
VVGGTGLYMRAALADLDLRPRVPPEPGAAVEREIAPRGPEALREELDPDVAARIHPRDRKRIARALELQRSGLEPPQRGARLWTASLRHPTVLVGLLVDRDELAGRIEERVDRQLAAGAAEEARRAAGAGASRTARAAIGFEELLAGDPAAMRAAQRRFARRQLTWMRRMPALRTIDRTGRDDQDVAMEILSLLD